MMSLSEELNKKYDYLVESCLKSGTIDQALYVEYEVKRGLRDSNGAGVLTGLTEISDVKAFDFNGGRKIPADGTLHYQGVDVVDLVKGIGDRQYGFEETTYLLLFGRLPNRDEFKSFCQIISDLQEVSGQFLRDVIMKAPSENVMNGLMRSVLSLYSYDEAPDDISVENVLLQCLQLIAKLPIIAVYSYQSYQHIRLENDFLIRVPKKGYSTAENILYMLREDGKFTELEAKVLDTALIIHAEHGGGNNSTFTNHVVTSSGTDTYSAMAASIASLKGPKHGGANLKVLQMFDDLKENVKDWNDENALRTYLQNILDRKAFDNSGLIYGMGHAVYTLSDPRQVVLKDFAEKLADEKGMTEELRLYENVERLAKELIVANRTTFKPICANVDFYSGFVYTMLGIPRELFTPIFAIARISGWSAHRLEELVNKGKIIRPAYKYVGHWVDFIPMDER
ncbi:MAG: citrate/2-methylcitrate synthase [Lachnospiraceae bacterium]|nr:citrate/2-methylcitrate synthase [Lachnospiraceae bacterium]